MNRNMKEQFDAIAEKYDRQRRQLIPCFDDFYGIAAALAERTSAGSPNVLDLGAGTGLMTAFVRDNFPHASYTLIDASESMLAQARLRFAHRPEGIRYVVGDYTACEFAETFDIVVSSLSIHHLTDPDKRKLFKAVCEWLNAGGIFINADQTAASSAELDRYYRQRWDAAVRQSGLDAEAIEASQERRKHDLNAKTDDQLAWLREAGFAEVECVYKYYDFAVFYAEK